MDASKLGVGSIITDEQHREAIHCAIAPVVAACQLKPGWHVRLNEKGHAIAGTDFRTTVGIVDPFLRLNTVEEGQTFWLFLYPGSITSLRHEWTHPAFEREEISAVDAATARKVAARFWLDDFLAKINEEAYSPEYYVTLESLIEDTKKGNIRFAFDTPDFLRGERIKEDLVRYVEDYTGTKIGETPFFSCAC